MGAFSAPPNWRRPTPAELALFLAGTNTEEGKATSSRNRLSHGFASSAILIDGEHPEEFKALLAGLTDEYTPVTDTEVILVERMAQHQWLCLRSFRLQGIAFTDELRKTPEFSIPQSLGLLIRYHTTADRAFHRAHNELVKMQKERKKSEIGFVPQNPQKPAEPQPETLQTPKITPWKPSPRTSS
jgi:hypothetical protein